MSLRPKPNYCICIGAKLQERRAGIPLFRGSGLLGAQKSSESNRFRSFFRKNLTLRELRRATGGLEAVLLNAQRTSNQHK